MIRATVSEVKDGISSYLRRVRAGESVLILQRKTPVARIVPVGLSGTSGSVGDEADRNAKLTRLESSGVVARRSSGSPLEVVREPLSGGARVLDALLEERSEERREGYR